MPRKRRAARAFHLSNKTEPRDLQGSLRYWTRRIEEARAAGQLPLVVERSTVRNLPALLVAISQAKGTTNAAA